MASWAWEELKKQLYKMPVLFRISNTMYYKLYIYFKNDCKNFSIYLSSHEDDSEHSSELILGGIS
jgi:hypothetical protein